jgi:hypothetical protein
MEGPAREALDHILEGGGRRRAFYHPETGELWAFAAIAADIPDEAVQEAEVLCFCCFFLQPQVASPGPRRALPWAVH